MIPIGYNIQPMEWGANIKQYPWARNPYQDFNYRWYINYEKSGSSQAGFFNECGVLAKWMVDKGWRVDTTHGFQEVHPGDIIFFTEVMKFNGFPINFQNMLEGYDYRGITHAAICTEIECYFDTLVGSQSSAIEGEWRYVIKVITLPSFMEQYLRNTSGGWNSNYDTSYDIREFILDSSWNYTNSQGLMYCLPAMDTISMVCRPDLSTSSGYLKQQAELLGLHTVPENEDQLNIIKRCRLCTDIEWTPGIDYYRPMPITGEENQMYYDMHWVSPGGYWDYQQQAFGISSIMVDGEFSTDKTYKGMPWTLSTPEDAEDNSQPHWPNYVFYSGLLTQVHPQQFLSMIENENAHAYNDGGNLYPIYGWNEPVDLLRFVFGTSTCHNYLSDDTDAIMYCQNIFNLIINNTTPDQWGSLYYVVGHLDSIDNFQGLKLGDIVGDIPNVGIITDIIRDNSGNIEQVELTEATRYGLINPNKSDGPSGGLLCRRMLTLPQLITWYRMSSPIDE